MARTIPGRVPPSEPPDLDERRLLLAPANTEQEEDQQQDDAPDRRPGDDCIPLVLDAALDVVLELSKLRFEVISGDPFLRHQRLSFCSVFFFEILHAANVMTMMVATNAIAYGTMV